MDAVASLPVFVVFAGVAIVALVQLKQTRLFWLPGVALMGYGVAIVVGWPTYETRDSGGLEGLSSLVGVAASLVVVAGGIVCLNVGARSRKRALLARRSDIPTAIVTKDSGQP